MPANEDVKRQIGHLLRRAGFGATPDQISAYAAKGVTATVDELIGFGAQPDELGASLSKLEGDLFDLHNLEDIQTLWLYRMMNTTRPLEEKMTLFWHGHFATANYKVNNPAFMHQQNQTQRKYALGNFKELTLAMAKDPAMLLWLDGATNRKAAPNENFGRELMELFTLGIGNYSEDDVHAAARAFTGWNLNYAQGTFVFNAGQHDNSTKTFRGKTGNINGDDVINNVVADPATAKRLATKLFTFFAYDNPEPAVVQPLADLYLKSGFEIKPVVRSLLLSDAFYSDKAFQNHFKSPVDYVTNAVRSLGGKVRERSLLPVLREMGQELFNPPNVAGWEGGASWINAGSMVVRFNLGSLLADAVKGAQGFAGGYIDPESIVKQLGLKSWDSIIQVFGGALTGGLQPTTVDALKSYASQLPNPAPQALDMKLRGLLHLMMTTPEFQVA